MAHTLWILESTGNPKFPYRLSVTRNDSILLRLRVQERWPGQKGHVFCLRDEEDELDSAVEVERVPVVSLQRFGKRLAVVLDRPKNKRCDFLFLSKPYKTREGEYEQIFWRTERGLRERKPKVKLSTYASGELAIAVDSGERYPWRFPGHRVWREKLPMGDYALMRDGAITALVERKTRDNLLHEFGRMQIFHQQLSELDAYRTAALVIEANYSDFLNPKKMKHYPPAFAAQAIAELHALHPGLTIVFAGSRKLAQEWCLRFFSAVAAHKKDVPHHAISDAVTGYGTPPDASGGTFYALKHALQHDFPAEFTIAEIRKAFPDAPEATIQRTLRTLKADGAIASAGRGKGSYWCKRGAGK